jgi:hypothetical protein
MTYQIDGQCLGKMLLHANVEIQNKTNSEFNIATVCTKDEILI